MFGKIQNKYLWTTHSHAKMRQYGLTESRVKRIIRFPDRTEEGIVENAVACMQKAGGKKYSEIWAMYIVDDNKLKIITAWRYPGKSPKRDPIPIEVMRELRNIL